MYYIVHNWYRQQQQQCQQKYGGETSEKRRSKTDDEAKSGKAVEVAEAMGISEFTLCRWLRKDLKGKQLERLNSAVKKIKSGKVETHREEEH